MEFMSSLRGGLDELKPSLFELLSEQQLGSLIPPSLRYLLALATQRHPRYLLRILNSFDELYAGLMIVVERYYLRTYGGGFTENFYGLKRERVLRVKGGEVPRAQLGAASLVRETLQLRNSDVWKNLAVMVGIPYLKRKLDEAHDIHAPQAMLIGQNYARAQTLPDDATLRQRILHFYKWFLRRVYPSVNAAYYFALLAFNLAYLFDGSKYSSPFLWLIGTRIRRLGEADYRAIQALTEPLPSSASKPSRPGQTNSLLHPRVLAQTVGPRMLSSLRILLPTSIFALKFLEWWHASDFARQLSRKAAEGIELPPPTSGMPPAYSTASTVNTTASSTSGAARGSSPTQPQSSLKHPTPPISATTNLPILTVPLPGSSSTDLCPICNQRITTPTAAPSGFVFCYTCIHRWVEGTHERQERFMAGEDNEGAVWGEEEDKEKDSRKDRWASWESGKGRCAVSARRILGGTEGLRRIIA